MLGAVVGMTPVGRHPPMICVGPRLASTDVGVRPGAGTRHEGPFGVHMDSAGESIRRCAA